MVRVDSSCTNAEKEDSLAAIKSQVGVNTHDLEQAREILEEEDTNAKRVFEEGKVVCLEKILKRVLTRDEIDENEVWDARECLRYACMEAGNKYLWDSRFGCVEKAIEHFEKAKQIVELQQKSQQKLADSESSPFVQLNLLYLHGQAVVNIGISLVDTSHRKLSIPRVKVMRAIEEFKRAKEEMAKLRSLAGKATQSPSSTSAKEATSYILKSKQLESLACRWMGRGLWLISEEKKAIASFEEASQFVNADLLRKWQRNIYSEDDILDMMAEAIYATCDLADRCYSIMEVLDHQSSSWKKGHEMLDVITHALNRHMKINKSIEQFSCPVRTQFFRAQYDISSTEDVLMYRNDIMKWWKERFDNPTNDMQSTTKAYDRLLVRRSDTSSSTNNVILASNHAPSNFILSSDGGKRKRYQRHQKGFSRTNSFGGKIPQASATKMDAVYALSSEALHHRPCPPVKFRKWGDELLIAGQQKAGREDFGVPRQETVTDDDHSLSYLAYPSIAPSMPKEFQV